MTDDLQRRLAAYRASTRVLARPAPETTLAAGLAALAADAVGLDGADLDERVDVYGGGIVAQLERRVGELLGFPAAAFFPTGTMAQQVALRCWAARTGNDVVALHPTAHPVLHERGALSVLSGLRTVHPSTAARQPSASEVRGLDEPFGTLLLELPMREAGFVLPTWEELGAVVGAARERGAKVHVDGARLWECTEHFGRGLAEIAGVADSVYVSFYKSLGGLSGAMLAGPSEFVDEARAWRHRYGGQLFQQYPVALAALAGLERELPLLPTYVRHARVVAAALRAELAASVAWFRLVPEVPHTHQFQAWLPFAPEALTEASMRTAEETGVTLFRGWRAQGPYGPPGVAVTEVTVARPGLDWTPEDVRAAAREFLARVRHAS